MPVSRRAYLTLLLALVVCVSGCGGSSASSERAKLVREVRASGFRDAPNGAISLPNGVSMQVTPALIDCFAAKAGQLPLGQLRELASPNPPSSLALVVFSRCVSEGTGVAGVRAAITQSVAAQSSVLPPAVRSCVIAKVGNLSPAELGRLFLAASQNDRAAAQRVGAQMAASCLLSDPDAARALVIAGMRAKLKQVQLPPAFTQCMIAKVQRLPASQIDKLISVVAGGNAASDQLAGEVLGRTLGQQCVAELKKPASGG
jgi:hypothetical protein